MHWWSLFFSSSPSSTLCFQCWMIFCCRCWCFCWCCPVNWQTAFGASQCSHWAPLCAICDFAFFEAHTQCQSISTSTYFAVSPPQTHSATWTRSKVASRSRIIALWPGNVHVHHHNQQQCVVITVCWALIFLIITLRHTQQWRASLMTTATTTISTIAPNSKVWTQVNCLISTAN